MTRVVLVLLCVVLVLLALVGMRRGWVNRARRQGIVLPQLPPTPNEFGERRLGPETGLYVGTAFAANWQDRVVYGGLGTRAAAEASLYETGLALERVGAPEVFIPAESITAVRLAPGLAGKVTGAGGLLVVRWRLGDHVVDTAFRADDKRTYPQWVAAIESVAGARHAEGAPRD